MAIYFNNNNNNVMCAADSFMHNVSELDFDASSLTFTGVSKGEKFTLVGVDSFKMGRKTHHTRLGVNKVDFYYNGRPSSIALESVFVFLLEAYASNSIRRTYKGLVGNCMGNEVAQGLKFNPNWVELVTKTENDSHREIWTKCFKVDVRVVFSARDLVFRGYIERIPVLTDADIKAYPGIHRVVYEGTEYWEVY